MSSLAGEYLPPLVTKLLGDNSDLLAAAAEAEAAMKSFGKTTGKSNEDVGASFRRSGREVDEFTDLVVRRMRAGESAVQVLRREITRVESEVTGMRKRLSKDAANQGLYADFKRANDELRKLRGLAKQIAPELLAASQSLGQKLGLSFAGAFANVGSLIVPAVIAAVVPALPVIAALIGSAVAVGLGLGFIGLGAVFAAMFNSKVKRLFGELGQAFKKAIGFAVTGAFDDALVKAIRAFTKFVPNFGRQLRKIFDALAPALVPLANALGEGLTAFLADIGQIIPQIMPALLNFIATIPDVMAAVSEFLIAITKDGPALSRFITDAANAIAVFLHGAGEVIAWLTAAYLWIVKLNDAFPFMGWQRSLEGLGTAIDAVKNFFIALWDKIVEGAKAVGSWFADLGTGIWDWLVDAGRTIADWYNATIAWFKALPGKVIGFLASLPGKVIGYFKWLAHQTAYWVGFMVGKWVQFVSEAPVKIIAVLVGMWLWIQNKTAEGVHATIERIKAFPGQVAAFFSQMWTSVTGWVKRTWESVGSWFARTKQSMIEHIVSGINSVISFFRALPGKAAEQGKAFKDRIISFFKGAKDWLFNAGKNLVVGLINGVTGYWGWAIDKIKGFAGDIASGFKDALGIHSPSKVFAGFGANTVAGYVQGLTKGMPSVWAAWRQMSAAVPAPAYAGGGVSAAMAQTLGGGTPAAAYRGPSMVATDIYIDGKKVVSAVTPAAQRRKNRSGQTGLG